MAAKYSDIIMYLDAIANNANGNFGISPHGFWWHTDPTNLMSAPLAYTDFTKGTVNGVGVPIIGTDSNQTNPLQSLFYLLLTTPGGTQGYNQMPWKGPYVTDSGFSVTLADGTNITGAQIQANLQDWLGNGYPQ